MAQQSARISVVIPTWNEEAALPALLERLRAAAVHEVVVADGGSKDATVAIARAAGAIVVDGAKGRGPQLHAGAEAASGDILWFLHADVLPPIGAERALEAVLSRDGVVAGCFRIRTVPSGGPWTLGPLLRVADLRSRWTSRPYGDQGIFVGAATYRAVGGFADLPLLEDLDFVTRVGRSGRIVTLTEEIEVSGRRFESRPLFYFGVMNVFPMLFRLGVSAERLDRMYRAVR